MKVSYYEHYYNQTPLWYKYKRNESLPYSDETLKYLLCSFKHGIRFFYYNPVFESNVHLPFILQVGVALLHVLSALHVRDVDAEIVYPVLQLNVAID